MSLIFGAEETSSSIAVIGGLVARGEETATGWPNAVLPPGRPNPPRIGGIVADGGGGLAIEPEPDGVGAAGTVPLLNSAQRGHLRLVSMVPCQLTFDKKND